MVKKVSYYKASASSTEIFIDPILILSSILHSTSSVEILVATSVTLFVKLAASTSVVEGGITLTSTNTCIDTFVDKTTFDLDCIFTEVKKPIQASTKNPFTNMFGYPVENIQELTVWYIINHFANCKRIMHKTIKNC